MEAIQSYIKELSYYHYVDPKYPMVDLSLPQVYDIVLKRDDDIGVTWHRPAERFSYKELIIKGHAMAKGLIAAGLSRGDTVVAIGCQGSEGLIMFIACSLIGCKFSGLHLYSPIENIISSGLDKFKPALLLIGNIAAGAKFENVFHVATEYLKSKAAKDKKPPLVYFDAYAGNSQDCMDSNMFGKSLQDLIKSGESIEESRLEIIKTSLSTNEPTFIALSSGSTGQPKGVIIGSRLFTNSYFSPYARAAETIQVMGICNLCTDDVAMIVYFVSNVMMGISLVVAPSPSATMEPVIAELCEVIEKYKVNQAYFDMSYACALIAQADHWTQKYDLSTFKGFVLPGFPASEAFRTSCLKHFPNSINGFGMSECLGFTGPFFGGGFKPDPASTGKPLPNVAIKVVDEQGSCVKRNVRGEMLLKSPSIFLEYLDEPEKTREAFTKDGWFKTGDCVYMDENGEVFVVGRMSHTERFKVENDVVYASPIERVLKDCPGIKDCAVIGVLLGDMADHELIYEIVLNEPGSMRISDVRDYAVVKMQQSIEWPARVVFRDAIPRAVRRNKVKKLQMMDEFKAEVLRDKSYAKVEYDFEVRA